MKDNYFYAKHILESIKTIEDFIDGVDYNEFMEDKLIQNGVIRELEVIGEAAKRLTEEYKKEHDSVPWKYICGMRDKLIHDYFSINLDDVWRTANEDLKELKEELGK